MSQTATTAAPEVHYEINVGETAIAGGATFIALLIFILLLLGKFPGLRVRAGKNSVEVGKESTPGQDTPAKALPQPVAASSGSPGYVGVERRMVGQIDTKALYTAQLIVKRRVEMVNLIKSAQKDYADEIEDDFWPILDRRQVDEWQVETVWSRLHRIFWAMADLNHILDCCTDSINPEYLTEKIATFRRRYEKLLKRTDSMLPPFGQIEEPIRRLISQVIYKYAEIAQAHEDRFAEFVTTTKATTDNQELRDIIDKIASRDALEEL